MTSGDLTAWPWPSTQPHSGSVDPLNVTFVPPLKANLLAVSAALNWKNTSTRTRHQGMTITLSVEHRSGDKARKTHRCCHGIYSCLRLAKSWIWLPQTLYCGNITRIRHVSLNTDFNILEGRELDGSPYVVSDAFLEQNCGVCNKRRVFEGGNKSWWIILVVRVWDHVSVPCRDERRAGKDKCTSW